MNRLSVFVLGFFTAVLILEPQVHAAGFELEEPVPGPTALWPRQARTASAGGRFLTIWQQNSGAGEHLYGILSDANGKRIGAEAFPVLRDTSPETMHLLGVGGSFVLFWRDRSNHTYLAEISLDGAITFTREVATDGVGPTATWNGEHFLLTDGRTGSVLGVLLDRAGNVVRRSVVFPPRLLPSGFIALRDGSFVSPVSVAGELRGLALSPIGQVAGNDLIDTISPSTGGSFTGASASGLSGGGSLIAYVITRYGHPSELRTSVLVRPDPASPPIVLPANGYMGIGNVQVIRHGTDYAVYFHGTRDLTRSEGWELVGIKIDSKGRPLTTEATVISRDVPPLSGFTYASNDHVALGVTIPYHPLGGQILSYALLGAVAGVQPEILSWTPSLQAEVRAGVNARGFVAAWNDFVGAGTAVHTASVNGAGQRTSAITTFPGHMVTKRIASGATDHLFFRATSTDLIASRIGADAALLQNITLAKATESQDVTGLWTGTGYVVVWSVGQRILSVFLGGNEGTPTTVEVPLDPPPPGHVRTASNVLLAFDGQIALLVWNEWVSPVCNSPGGCGEITGRVMARRMSSSGAVLDATATEITNQLTPLLAGGNGQFLLYTKLDRSTRVLRAEASTIQVGPATPVTADPYYVADIFWNGREYSVAMSAINRYLGSMQLNAEGQVTSPLKAIATGGVIGSVGVASTPTESLVVSSVSEQARTKRARAYGKLEFAPLPPVPLETRITDVQMQPGGATLVFWRPTLNADGYVIEVFRDGRFNTIAFAGADETFKSIQLPVTSHFRVRAFNAGGFFIAPPSTPRRRSAGR